MQRQGQSPQRPKAGQKQKKRKKKKQGQPRSQKDEKERNLRYLQEVFKDVIDATLVHSLFEDYNSDVKKVLETLFQLTEGSAEDLPPHRKIPSFKDITDHLTREESDSDDGSSQLDEEYGHQQMLDDDRDGDVTGRHHGDRHPPRRDLSIELPLLPKDRRDNLEMPGGRDTPPGRGDGEDGSHETEEAKSPLSYHNVRYGEDPIAHDRYPGIGETDLDSLSVRARDMTSNYGYGNVETLGYQQHEERTFDDILAEARRLDTSQSEYGNDSYTHGSYQNPALRPGGGNMDLAKSTTTHLSYGNVPYRYGNPYENGYNYNGPSYKPVAANSAGTLGIRTGHAGNYPAVGYTTAATYLPTYTSTVTGPTAPIYLPTYTSTVTGQNYVHTFYDDTALKQGPPTSTIPGGYFSNQLGYDHKGSTQEKVSNFSNVPRDNSPLDRTPVGQDAPRTQTPSWPKKSSNIIPSAHHQQHKMVPDFEPLPKGKVLCLMRGLPGSGKSTLARRLLISGQGGRIISTDDYFTRRDGSYLFNPHELDRAHESAQLKAQRAMDTGRTPIIIDNTNTQLWEMKTYVQLAQKYNYTVVIREPNTAWRNKVGELARRNTHGVGADKISKMLIRFEKLDSIESILRAPDKSKVLDKRGHQDTRRHHSRDDHIRDPKDRSAPPHTGRYEDVKALPQKRGQTENDGRDALDSVMRSPPAGKASPRKDHKRVVEEPVVALESQSQSSKPPVKESGPDSRFSGSGGSITGSNLSEIESVITSIPIASCLQEDVQSFERTLAQIGDISHLGGSSGELLSENDKNLLTGVGGKLQKDDEVLMKNSHQPADTGRDDFSARHTISGRKHETFNSEKYGQKNAHRHLHLEDSVPHRTNRETDPTSGNDLGYGQKTDHLNESGLQKSASDFSRYLTRSEPVEDRASVLDQFQSRKDEEKSLRHEVLGQSQEPSDQSHSHSGKALLGSRHGLEKEKERQIGLEAHRTETNNEIPLSSRVESSSHRPKVGDQQKHPPEDKSFRSGYQIQGEGRPSGFTTSQAANHQVSSSKESFGNKSKVDERLSNRKSDSAQFRPVREEHSEDDPGGALKGGIPLEEHDSPNGTGGSPSDKFVWESKGAKPKMKRATSEPFRPLAAEDPGCRSSSPSRKEMPAPFMSLATVPQIRKKQRRAPTPFGRRMLAANFSSPDLPIVSELSTRKKGNSKRTGSSEDKVEEKYRVKPPDDYVRDSLNSEENSRSQNLSEGNSVDSEWRSDIDTTAKDGPSEKTSKTKDKPKRKIARSGRTDSPPLLSPETKRKALTQNWGSGAVTKEVVPPLEVPPPEPSSRALIEMKSQTSQTDPTHFKLLERVNVPTDKEPTGLGNLRMMRVSQAIWRVDGATGQKAEEDIPYRRKIDKSSMTDETSEMTPEMNLKVLCAIFPHIDREIIKGHLDRFNGDAQVVSEELLNEDLLLENARERRRRQRAQNHKVTRRERHAVKESQTTKADFLLSRLINDGCQPSLYPGISVKTAKRGIAFSAFGGEIIAKTAGKPPAGMKDVGTATEFDELMPQFDKDLSKLLLLHDSVPYLELCDILEKNHGDTNKAEREIQFKYPKMGQAPQLGAMPPRGQQEAQGLSNSSRNKRPEPLGHTLTSDRLKDDDKGSLSDHESPRHHRGRSAQSERGGAQVGSLKRRTRSLPRRRSGSPRVDEKTRQDWKSPLGFQKPLQTPDSILASMTSKKDELRQAMIKKQPKPSGLGRHLAVGEGKLPNKYSPDTSKRREEQLVNDTNRENTSEQRPIIGGRSKDKQKERSSKTADTQQARVAGEDNGGLDHLVTKSQGVEENTSLPPKESNKDGREGMAGASGGVSGAQGGSANQGPAGEEKEDQNLDAPKGGRKKQPLTTADKGRATPADLLGEEGKGVPARFHAGMTFQLDMAFALQLQEIFGSVGFNIDTDVLADDDLAISVDLELAKTLHAAWSKSFKQKFEREEKQLMEMMKQDEALAKQLHQEEEKKQLEEIQRKREAKYRGTETPTGSPLRGQGTASPHRYPPMGAPAAGTNSPKLQDIMDTEMAVQISRDMMQEDAGDKGTTMAVNLRRKELRKRYPGMDESWLENIFMSQDFDFEATVKQIDLQVGSGQPKNVFSSEALKREEERQLAEAKRQSQNFIPVETGAAHQEEGDELDAFKSGNFQSLGHPGYRDYRAEANQHYQQRQECFRKASEAFRNGQKEQAAYYSQQGHRHTALLQEANQRASEAILADTNKGRGANEIDLHGLHRDEVIPTIQQKIDERRVTLKYSSPYVHNDPYLYIITGRGNNSKDGIAKIKPVVINYLKTKGIRYENMNPGLIRIKVA